MRLASCRLPHVSLLLFLGVCLAAPALAQEVTGSLQGTILSPEKTPEPEVKVTVAGPHLQGIRSTVTDRRGFFQFLLLPPGTYELRAGRIGSRPILVRNLTVDLGRTTAVPPLTLELQPIQMDSVVVVAPAVSLDPVRTTMGGVIKTEDYASLPVDRDYRSIINILPHANDSHRGDPVNVGGSTGLENQYYIDGVSTTDTKLANRSTDLPYNFVRTVNVRTGAYEAQFGRALGAAVDAVTYSGTNDFEATLFGQTQPSSWSMDPKSTPVIHEEGGTHFEYGGRASGPLVHDRLWYSVALSPKTDAVDKEIEGHGLFQDKATATRFANKLTWRASPSTNLELSVFGDPTSWNQVAAPPSGISTVTNPDPLLYRVESGGTAASLRCTVAPTKSALLQMTLGRQWDRYSSEGATAIGRSQPQYTDYMQGSMEGGVPITTMEDRGRTSVSLQGSLTLSKHSLMAGANYEDLSTASAMTLLAITRTDSATWLHSYETYSGSFHNRSPAAFLQDTWRITDRLALNIGLRWSGQYLVGASGNTAQRIPDEWQPRLGFSWGLGSRGSHRLFGSYGRFHQTIPTNIAVLWFVDYTAIYSTYSTDPRSPGAVPDDTIDATSTEEDASGQVPQLEAENVDEFTLGYERVLGRRTIVTMRGIRRALRSSFQWGADLSRNPIFVLGTPGKGDFGFLPPPKREYTALEVSAEGTWQRLGYRASYVLSRSWGNYAGLYNSDFNAALPGAQSTYFMPYQAENSTGFLPNDHPHVFKLSASYAAPLNISCGAFLAVEAGSPINDFAAGPDWPWIPSFEVQRGGAGRTPTIWNLDLRLAYDLSVRRGSRTRLLLDLLHVGNPRGTVQVDEWHYNAVDTNGNPSSPNPNYKQPKAYQPAMALRLGMEVTF